MAEPRERSQVMDGLGTAKNLIINPATLPVRNGKRPITIRGPLHVQCNDYGDFREMHYLLEQVLAWPDIEATPLPIGSANLVSLKIAAEVATQEPHVFIAGREFGRILFWCSHDLFNIALRLCALGYCPRLGGTSLLHQLRFVASRCDGRLHATK